MTNPDHGKRQIALPETIPLFPLAGALLLPGGQLPLNIFEPRYLRMVDDVLGAHRLIGMIQPKEEAPRGDAPALYALGAAGRITSFSESEDGRYQITLTGISRFRLGSEHSVDTPYRQAEVEWAEFAGEEDRDQSASTVDRVRLIKAMHAYLDAEGLKTDWDAVDDAPAAALVASLSMGCPFAPNEKQALLEARDIAERAKCLIALMEMSSAADGEPDQTLQ